MATGTSFTSFAPFKAPEGSEAEVLVIALALAYESVSSGNIAPVVAWVDKVLDDSPVSILTSCAPISRVKVLGAGAVVCLRRLRMATPGGER